MIEKILQREKRRNRLAVVIMLFVLLGLGFYLRGSSFTGFVIGNVTNTSNVTQENITDVFVNETTINKTLENVTEVIENITVETNITINETNITLENKTLTNITQNITENITIELNETVENITSNVTLKQNITYNQSEAVIQTTFSEVEINKPVKWTQKINTSKVKKYKLPEKAFNVKANASFPYSASLPVRNIRQCRS
jgi:hypothetical protein